jgi:hypothetical protein
VIEMQPAPVPGNAAEAMAMLRAAFGHLSGTDWAGLGCRAQGEVLAGLCGVQAQLTAVHARVLSAFTASGGYEPDGHGSARQWLMHRTGISRGAARGAVGWQRRLARHALIAAAMAAGAVPESLGKEIAGWTDPLPQEERDAADKILLEAAAGGCPADDLELLARTIYETWQAAHPGPGDGTGGEDGFEDRLLLLGTTFGGAGVVKGDLTATCAAKLQAVFDALGKHAGPGDWRTAGQRQHDALEDALGRLIKAGLLPEAAGQATMAQVVIPFSALRGMHGASEAEQAWIAAQAGQPGWLSGIGAQAAACDATIVPVVTGTVDWQAADAMTEAWIDAHGLGHGRLACGCTCGGCTCTPPAPITAQTRARLRRALLAMAADAMSGPGGLAAYLRAKLLQAPYAGKSLPLDVGRASSIPDHLRRAVILRDRHCQWAGGCDRPPGASHVHHIVERSEGGKTRLTDLILVCQYHHLVSIHRQGWKLIRHADGTTEAISPHGQVLRSHGPPEARAG